MIIKNIFGSLVKQHSSDRDAQLYRRLMRHEAQIGGTLFGPIQPGGRREFFCLDEHTWVWHEEWLDQNGQQHIKTTRYDVRPNGILKVQDGHYQSVTPSEALRLRDAVRMYTQRVRREVYKLPA